jgi:hypothetical protein
LVARGPKQNRIEWPQHLQPVFRHHFAVATEVIPTPIEIFKLQMKGIARAGEHFENLSPSGNHFLPDSISWDCRNPKRLHKPAIEPEKSGYLYFYSE